MPEERGISIMKVVIFGASGTADGSVLKVSLSHPIVEEVRAITRRALSINNDKLRVFLHGDYLDYAAVSEAFADVEACFYCLGISATQVSGEQEYRRITHDFAFAAAQMLKIQSSNAVFHFISGQGTRLDSRFMWARVKAETERDLLSLTNAVCWRPAFIAGELSPNSPRLYRILRPFAKLLKPFRGLYV
jgi:uncharacterized protein YbjT (DUF2867 family)